MSAQVPYLARMARRAAGGAALRPSRPLSPGTAELAGRLLAGEVVAGSPRGHASDAGPAAPAGAAGAAVTLARADRPGLTPAGLGPPLAARAQPDPVPPATPTPADPAAQPVMPLPSPVPAPLAGAQLPAGPARGRSPGSPVLVPSPGTDAERPHRIELAAGTRAASTRPAAASAPPAARPPASRTEPAGEDARRDRGPSPAAAAAGSVLPPLALTPSPNELAGTGPSGSRQQAASGPEPARVSIGTIEVTVVPPARQAVRASESRPPAQAPRVQGRPASLLAAAAEAGRLRDGLRRWYGIAQG